MTTRRKYFERQFILLLSILLFTLPVFAQDYYYTDKLFGKHFVFTPKETEIAVKFRAGVTPTQMMDVMRQSGFSLKTEGLEELQYGVFALPEGMPFSTAKEQLLRNALVAGAVPVFVDQEGYERYIDPEWLTVQFNDNVSEVEAESIISQWGSKVAIKHWTPGYYTITLPKAMTVFQAVRTFMALPQVKFSEPASYGFNDLLQDTYLNQQWHLRNTGQESGYTVGSDIKAFPAWDIAYGDTNVVLVIIDTGIDQTHPDLQGNIVPRGNEDWDFSGTGVEPIDTDGHGTSVAGIAAAIMNNIGVRGVAPASRIMPLKVDLRAGMNQNRADAINYAVSRRNHFTRVVISCSWRASGDLTAIHTAIQNAVNNNIPVFFAAGNFNTTPVTYPARYPETIAVGAMAPCGEVRKSPSTCDGEDWGSNYGEDLDIAAPGVRIYTTDIQGTGGYNPNRTQSGELSDQSYTRFFNGTSSACPQAAAVVALMLAVNSSQTVSQLRTTLTISADKVGGYNYNWSSSKPGHSQELGYGRINALRAVGRAYVTSHPDYEFVYDAASFSHYDNLDMIFLAAPNWCNAAGTYRNTERHRLLVQVNRPFIETPLAWYLGPVGYSWANENTCTTWLSQTVTANTIRYETVFYRLNRGDLSCEDRWAPFNPNPLPKEYAYLGRPLIAPVISGFTQTPVPIYRDGSGTVTCNLSQGNGNITYVWTAEYTPPDIFVYFSGNTATIQNGRPRPLGLQPPVKGGPNNPEGLFRLTCTASNGAGSSTRTFYPFIVYDPPPPPPGGCPFVYAWKDSGYAVDNNILPQSQLPEEHLKAQLGARGNA